jgi:hypothetical protein
VAKAAGFSAVSVCRLYGTYLNANNLAVDERNATGEGLAARCNGDIAFLRGTTVGKMIDYREWG